MNHMNLGSTHKELEVKKIYVSTGETMHRKKWTFWDTLNNNSVTNPTTSRTDLTVFMIRCWIEKVQTLMRLLLLWNSLTWAYTVCSAIVSKILTYYGTFYVTEFPNTCVSLIFEDIWVKGKQCRSRSDCIWVYPVCLAIVSKISILGR